MVCSLDSPPLRLPHGPPSLARAIHSQSVPRTHRRAGNIWLTCALGYVRALDHRRAGGGLAERDFIDYGVLLDDGSTTCTVAIACGDIVFDNALSTIETDHLRGVLRQNYGRCRVKWAQAYLGYNNRV